MTRHRLNLRLLFSLVVAAAIAPVGSASSDESGELADIEKQFRTLPMEARRLTGPLFWLHGGESRELLEMYLGKVVEGGNGCFTAESRPHNDWLGPGWYRDLDICLQAAKKHNLKMWIFAERWWPSGEVGGEVPQQYGSKYMDAAAMDVVGPRPVWLELETEKVIAVVAGKVAGDGVDGDSLVDLTEKHDGGRLRWDAPAGNWRLMTFTWRYSEGRRGRLLVDGASRDAVDWYIRTVYQPHYDRFADDFGKTIVGYFYDEPETFGDWGTEVIPMLKERGVDWKKALVAWKYKLANANEQVAAKYQYQDAFAETWGRTLYGALTDWCREHNVQSIGHWLEHRREYLAPEKCAGNMFQVQKYSEMGAIDAIGRQFVPGQKDDNTYQSPKLGSSISHVYGKADDLAMVEIFGARGQDLPYPEIKWWTDHMHASGINFHIPHAFNPRSPYDRDCPPYFYNNGYEPRWPLYRVYADYTSRLSLMLSGGRHVCPVALLYLGNSFHVGEAVTPEDMTTALQDALFDCDWMPYDVFENDVKIAGTELHLRQEQYRVLIVPAVEVIPCETLARAKAFLEAGGIVIGYALLPSKSATLEKTSADITALRTAIWGDATEPSLDVCRTNDNGGRSYFLPEQPTPAQIQQVLTGDAGIHPTLEVLKGETDDWLHVLHRVKAGRDVFFIANQQHVGPAKQLRLRAHAKGTPECWDAMRNEIYSIPFDRVDENTAEFELSLEPLESVLIVFRDNADSGPPRIKSGQQPARDPIAVTRLATPPERIIPNQPPVKEVEESPLKDCWWVWYPEQNAHQTAAPGTRFFRKRLTLPAGTEVATAKLYAAADNYFMAYANGRQVGDGGGWHQTVTVDLAPSLRAGDNVLAISVTNATDQPNPAGLIGYYQIKLADGKSIIGRIDEGWKAAEREVDGWKKVEFDDREWGTAKEVIAVGGAPWGEVDGKNALTASPVKADPFVGRFTLSADWLRNGLRIFLEADDIQPEGAAAITLNGRYAGGFIGRPYRLDITDDIQSGDNSIVVEPFAPSAVRVAAYSTTD